MIKFLKGNPLLAGVLGLTLIATLMVGTFKLTSLPLIRDDGLEYAAKFTDASGLEADDQVEIAGIAVGTVEKITLAGDHVVIHFIVDRKAKVGNDSIAKIRVGNVLGAKHLELTPKGSGRLAERSVIPLSRTEPAYDVVSAFSDLTETVEEVDSEKLAEALNAVSDTFEDAPEQVKGTVRGLSKLSETIASRDKEISQLLERSETLTGSLNKSRTSISELVVNSNLLLDELNRRRDVISRLLVNTRRLSDQLHNLVQDNQSTLTPALKNLEKLVALLESKQDQLGKTIHNMAIYGRVFNNTVGNGPWFDANIPNVPTEVRFGDEGAQ